MKRCMIGAVCALLLFGATACQKEVISIENAIQEQEGVFSSLHIINGTLPSIHFTAVPTENKTPFFYIEMKEDVEVTLSYSFTKEEGNASIGCYHIGKQEEMSVPLDMAATEEQIKNEFSMTLHKGMNVFYIVGDGGSCSMSCSISDLPEEQILYANTVLPEDMAKEDISVDS